jgi:hypothetical protein
MSFKVLFFNASFVFRSKRKIPLISFIVLTIASPLKLGTLDLFLSSNVINHSIRNKHHDRTLIYVRFSTHNTACHTVPLKVLLPIAADVHI